MNVGDFLMNMRITSDKKKHLYEKLYDILKHTHSLFAIYSFHHR